MSFFRFEIKREKTAYRLGDLVPDLNLEDVFIGCETDNCGQNLKQLIPVDIFFRNNYTIAPSKISTEGLRGGLWLLDSLFILEQITDTNIKIYFVLSNAKHDNKSPSGTIENEMLMLKIKSLMAGERAEHNKAAFLHYVSTWRVQHREEINKIIADKMRDMGES